MAQTIQRQKRLGQSLVESFLVLALVAIVCFVSLRFYGQSLSQLMDDTCTQLVAAMSAAI